MYFSKAVIATVIASGSVLGAPIEFTNATTSETNATAISEDNGTSYTPRPCVDGDCETTTPPPISCTTTWEEIETPTPEHCEGNCPTPVDHTTSCTTTTTTSTSCVPETPTPVPCCNRPCENGPSDASPCCKDSCESNSGECVSCNRPCRNGTSGPSPCCENSSGPKSCEWYSCNPDLSAQFADEEYFLPSATWQYSVDSGAISTASTGLISKSTGSGRDKTTLVTFQYPDAAEGRQCQFAFYLDGMVTSNGSRKMDVFTTNGVAPGPTSSWGPGNRRNIHLGRLDVCYTGSTGFADWEATYNAYLTKPFPCKAPNEIEGFELVGVYDDVHFQWSASGAGAGPRILII